MKICISNKQRNITRAIVLILGLWFLLSLFNDAMVIPPINLVAVKIWEILTNPNQLIDIGITFFRMILAMAISIIGGISIGVLFSAVKPFNKTKETVKEMLKIFQIIPPVAVLIMAIIWFGLTGLPAVFIVVVSLIPLIAIQIIDAIDNIDLKLIEMGKVFKLSKSEMILRIYIPSIEPVLWSSVIVSLTIGAKMIVMGEVLTTSTGIGGRITTARLNIEPESVIAWTIIMMFLYYVIEFIINKIKDRKRFVQKNYFN